MTSSCFPLTITTVIGTLLTLVAFEDTFRALCRPITIESDRIKYYIIVEILQVFDISKLLTRDKSEKFGWNRDTHLKNSNINRFEFSLADHARSLPKSIGNLIDSGSRPIMTEFLRSVPKF